MNKKASWRLSSSAELRCCSKNWSRTWNRCRRFQSPVSESVIDSMRRCSVSFRSSHIVSPTRTPLTTRVAVANPTATGPGWRTVPAIRIPSAAVAASAGNSEPICRCTTRAFFRGRTHTAIDMTRIADGQAMLFVTFANLDIPKLVEPNRLKVSPTTFNAIPVASIAQGAFLWRGSRWVPPTMSVSSSRSPSG